MVKVILPQNTEVSSLVGYHYPQYSKIILLQKCEADVPENIPYTFQTMDDKKISMNGILGKGNEPIEFDQAIELPIGLDVGYQNGTEFKLFVCRNKEKCRLSPITKVIVPTGTKLRMSGILVTLEQDIFAWI